MKYFAYYSADFVKKKEQSLCFQAQHILEKR